VIHKSSIIHKDASVSATAAWKEAAISALKSLESGSFFFLTTYRTAVFNPLKLRR